MTQVTGRLSQDVTLEVPDDAFVDTEARSAISALDQRITAIEGEPDQTEPEVTQAELDALAALVEANRAEASADIVDLSDLVDALEDADRAEDDQQSADLIALAGRIGSGPAAANPNNDILLDSFTGTDDAKLDQAWTVAAASNPKRAIRLSGRAHTFAKPRTTFSGLRILGPGTGWQNPEISGTGGALPQCVVNLNITGSGFWLTGTSTTYDTEVSGICFKSANASSFYHHPYSAGTCYASSFDTLSFYGFKHVFGKPGDAFSMTLCTWKGEWTNVAVQDTQYSLRGSDNWLIPHALNYGWAGNNGGKYLVRFENLSKTAVRNFYLTARGGSRAVLVEGPSNQQGGLDISDCVIEGQNAGDPAMGALIVVKGGGVSFTNTKLNFGMARPSDFTDQTDTALVMVKGGIAVFDMVWTGKATNTPSFVPVFEVSGGVASISKVFGVQPLGTPCAVRKVGGTVVADATVSWV